MVYRPFAGTRLDRFVMGRLRQGRDVKVVITARNSETGTGKTTLGIRLARRWDMHGWSAKTKSCGTFKDYGTRYLELSDLYEAKLLNEGIERYGDVLIFDDAEDSVDKRRSTSKANVQISHWWCKFRFLGVVTIMTLPTSTMLDDRLKELSDIRINVVERGVAFPYRIYVNDHTHKIREYRFRSSINNEPQTLYFDKLPKTDPDYRHMHEMKMKICRDMLEEKR